jgi:hypothetical protein
VHYVNALLTVSRHSRLTSNTSCYYDNVCTSEGLLETRVIWKMATDPGPGVDVIQISGNTGYVNNVI